MSGGALKEFAQRLRAQGVVNADAPEPPEEPLDRPWFIALMQGCAGWLAGVLLLIFMATVVDIDSRVTLLVTGAILLGAAWAIYRSDPDAVFLDQLALAISIAGQVALVAGLTHRDATGLAIASTALLVQLGVLLAMPNRAARSLAALFAGIAWMWTARFLVRPGRGEELLFGHGSNEAASSLGQWALPLGWLITWAPLVALAIWLIRSEPQWMGKAWRQFARPALAGLMTCCALGGVITEPFAFVALGSEVWGVHFSWHALYPLLSIALSLIAAYGAFRLRSNALLGVAVLGALLHLGRFYYFYGTTLLAKSMLMTCVGAALLAAGFWLHHRLAATEAA